MKLESKFEETKAAFTANSGLKQTEREKNEQLSMATQLGSLQDQN